MPAKALLLWKSVGPLAVAAAASPVNDCRATNGDSDDWPNVDDVFCADDWPNDGAAATDWPKIDGPTAANTHTK